MFRYDPATGEHEIWYEGENAGSFTIQPDGALLVFGFFGAIRLYRDGEWVTLHDKLPGEERARFNDLIADPAGRVFCGTMPIEEGAPAGRLYRLELDGTVTELLDGIGCSNGLGFTPDRQQMYYTDSTNYKIYIFDYEQATGEISNQRVFLDAPEEEGLPDGMTVDAEGYVWTARWDGWALVRLAPDGHEDRRIPFPAKKVSSVTFGGPDYGDMYVTTAGGDDKAENGPAAGALFRLRMEEIQGAPEFYSRIDVPE
jgi:D-xylonolactonase